MQLQRPKSKLLILLRFPIKGDIPFLFIIPLKFKFLIPKSCFIFLHILSKPRLLKHRIQLQITQLVHIIHIYVLSQLLLALTALASLMHNIRQILLDVGHKNILFFCQKITVNCDGLSDDRKQIVILLQTIGFDIQSQPIFRTVMQKSNTTVIYIFKRQVLRHYFRIVTVDLNLTTVTNGLPIDKFVQGKEGQLQRLYPLAFCYVELNLIHMLLIPLLKPNESLLLLRFDQLVTRPLQNTQTCVVLLQRSPYLGVDLLRIAHRKHSEIGIRVSCHYYPAALIVHRYYSHCQGQGRTQGSSASTFDFADGYFGHIEFLNSAITKILLILPASFVHILVLVKINRLFLIGPFLMAQLPLLDIHRYFLLPGSFEDVHHIAEEYEAHPIVNFL